MKLSGYLKIINFYYELVIIQNGNHNRYQYHSFLYFWPLLASILVRTSFDTCFRLETLRGPQLRGSPPDCQPEPDRDKTGLLYPPPVTERRIAGWNERTCQELGFYPTKIVVYFFNQLKM